MKYCYIINAFYPYNPGETFLANELDYLTAFDKVYVCPIFANKDNLFKYKKTNLSNLTIINSKPFNKYYKLFYCISTIFKREFYTEIACLIKSKRFNVNNFIECVKFIAHGSFFTNSIYKQIKKQLLLGDEIVFYSYWLNMNAYVAACLNRKFFKQSTIAISRGHRVDIYEYAEKRNYIPMRNFIFKNIDFILPISKDAKDYLLDNYHIQEDKIIISRLGTKDYGINISQKKDVFKIVTCSWVRKVKRLDLLLESLSMVDFPIEWTHFGGGDLFDSLSEKVTAAMKKNKFLTCKLMGPTPNEIVLNSYLSNDYNLFINISESEGVPVSIMEAMSIGKPIVATDVGGSKEIVKNGINGYIISKDCTKEDIYNTIIKIKNLSDFEYEKMSVASRNIWEELSCADKNYENFGKNIKNFFKYD